MTSFAGTFDELPVGKPTSLLDDVELGKLSDD